MNALNSDALPHLLPASLSRRPLKADQPWGTGMLTLDRSSAQPQPALLVTSGNVCLGFW